MLPNKLQIKTGYLMKFVVGALFCQQLFAQGTETPSVIRVSPDKPEFSITLKANPSTYQWLLHQYNSDLITPIKTTLQEDPQLPKSQNLGASVNQHWEFKVDDQAFAVPTITHISFVQLQPWDLNTNLPEKDDLTIKVIIDPNAKTKPENNRPNPAVNQPGVSSSHSNP